MRLLSLGICFSAHPCILLRIIHRRSISSLQVEVEEALDKVLVTLKIFNKFRTAFREFKGKLPGYFQGESRLTKYLIDCSALTIEVTGIFIYLK